MTYEDALDTALSLAHDPDALEAYLRSVPHWRDDLERAISVSGSVALEWRRIAPDAAAQQRAQQQLLSVVESLGSAGRRSSLLTRLLQSFSGYRLAIAGITAAALIAFALAAGLPSLSGGGTQTAEAVIEGSVAEIGAGAVTISTNNASQQVTLSSDTVLTDSFGNTVEASKLATGQDVVLKGSREGDEFVASEVELRDRLFGVVTALNGDGIQLSSSKGDFFIFVTAQTEFEGVAQVGSFVEIKLVRLSDGSLRALEVEVEDEDEEEDGGEEDEHESTGGSDSSTPPLPPSPSGQSQSGSSDPPQVNDDHEGEEEHQDGEEQEDPEPQDTEDHGEAEDD
jgi:hypothetical protein